MLENSEEYLYKNSLNLFSLALGPFLKKDGFDPILEKLMQQKKLKQKTNLQNSGSI
jgi:hypothetical protein